MKKEQLFLLIKSLNKGEKSYFKKFSSRHTAYGNNNYIKLFDAIDKQKVYDEEKLKEKLKEEAIIKNLSSAKFYLLKLIIQCLTSFHSEEGVDYRIKELMQSIEVLGKKNLHGLRLTMLDKAKELALKYERYPLLIELLFMERSILAFWNDEDRLEKFYETFNADVEKYSELIINSTKVFSAKNKVVGAHVLAGRDRNDKKSVMLDTVFNNEVLPLDELRLTFEAKRNLISTHFFYYFFKSDFIPAYDYSKRALSLWDANPDMINQALPQYMASLQNYLLCCLNVCRFEEFGQVINQLKGIPKQFPGADTGELRLTIFNALHLELDKNILTVGFTEAIKNVAEIEKGLIELSGRYSKEFETVTLFNIAYLYFGAGEFKTALRWTRKVIDNSVPGIRMDTQTFTRMLNIMIYIELDDTDMVAHQLRSTLRFLQKNERLYKVESLMLNFFKSYLNLYGNKFTQELEELKSELEAVDILPGENPFNDIDFISWVESKLTKKSFEKIVLEKSNRKKEEMEKKLKEYFKHSDTYQLAIQ